MKQETYVFHIRTYGRTELAREFSPYTTDRTAWRRLQDWMASHPTLLNDLRATGYRDSQRLFTPQQVLLIVNALGYPKIG